jgi:acetyl esterase/lipase
VAGCFGGAAGYGAVGGQSSRALGDGLADRPTITRYAVSSSAMPTAAVIVFPGGGYNHLATNHEGRQIANWLNGAGITAFVVVYRLGPRSLEFCRTRLE